MEQCCRGRPEDFDSDPILEANELKKVQMLVPKMLERLLVKDVRSRAMRISAILL